MNFYICFGILLCFMCLITIPTFSTGMSWFGTNNDALIEAIFNPLNEKNYPISFFVIQYLMDKCFNISVKNGKIILKKKLKSVFKQKLFNSTEEIKELMSYSDGDLSLKFVRYFESFMLDEELFKEFLQISDINKNDTVLKEVAFDIFFKNKLLCMLLKKDINEILTKYTNKQNQFNYLDYEMLSTFLKLSKNSERDQNYIVSAFVEYVIKNSTVSKEEAATIFFNSPLFTDRINDIIKKYTNDQNQCNYKEMIAGFGDDYTGDKSFVLTYDQETQKWKKKYTN
ncbi:uncharacterized protein LOC126894990 isoform X2 [Daktulosphaira vitifoliae]|uniref:uncharacterized protein LOC126894990 isoform X2 n=1 Tax=Daktulosphaira vitifoliae TaxID=58002 RepID=UPI0021AA71B6|nr:uncharacterized protein LOC126894990 isoform X2 [Daktulosphaira vitifoliae]